MEGSKQLFPLTGAGKHKLEHKLEDKLEHPVCIVNLVSVSLPLVRECLHISQGSQAAQQVRV